MWWCIIRAEDCIEHENNVKYKYTHSMCLGNSNEWNGFNNSKRKKEKKRERKNTIQLLVMEIMNDALLLLFFASKMG